MKILGLTGGSGVGKSTVSALLVSRGAGAVDADAVYRTLCASCRPMLSALREAFGEAIFKDGTLYRPALARIVFADAAKLAQLNQITAPYIRDASLCAFAALADRVFVLYDAPTLFETGADTLCEAVIAVLADRETRIRRIIARDCLSEDAARARIDAQPQADFYRQRCRYILENNDGLPALECAVDHLYRNLIGGT